MERPLRVLAIGAHPDDMEFRSGGTLALLKNAGCEIGLATVCGGEGGSTVYGRDEISKIRQGEAAAAAAVLDAPYYCAGGLDMDIDYCHALRVKVVHVFRQFRPDVVLTVPPQDYHPDHEEASRLARAACFFAPIPNFPEQSLEPIDHTPVLYYGNAHHDIHGRLATIRFAVDITPVRETKLEMIYCHKSQREWIASHHGTDNYVLHVQALEEAMGERIGVEAAEGFYQHIGDGYPKDDPIRELLGSAVHEISLG